jgi:hypothetical protein
MSQQSFHDPIPPNLAYARSSIIAERVGVRFVIE